MPRDGREGGVDVAPPSHRSSNEHRERTRRRSRSPRRAHRDDRSRRHDSEDSDRSGRRRHRRDKPSRRSRSGSGSSIGESAERRSHRREGSPSRRRERVDPRHDDRRRDRRRDDDDRDSRRSRHHRRRSHSRSPTRKRRRRSPSHSRSPSPLRRSRKPLPSQQSVFDAETGTDVAPPVEKEQPNFAPTGLLAKESNTVAGTNITLKYHEPSNARKPPASAAWRMYVFKGADLLDTVPLAERTCWLFGREQKVADIFLEHPSASGQHAVVQFRHVQRKKVDELGFETMVGRVKPYLMDLESKNGTLLNGEKIGPAKYVELRDGDLVKFGESEREYVVQLPPKDAL